MKKILALVWLNLLAMPAYCQSIDEIELMIFQQHKPNHVATYAFPELPNNTQWVNQITPTIQAIEAGDHAILFKRLQERGQFKPLWSGMWQQDQKPSLHEIQALPITLWIQTHKTTPRTLSVYLIEHDHMLMRIRHPMIYNKPIYIDHPDYGIVFVISKKPIEEENMMPQHQEQDDDTNLNLAHTRTTS